MKLALELAEKGIGKVNPNPLVGAIIVKEGKIIGQGYHEKYGGAHAEVNAFRNLTECAEGGTLYVNLEPCCHYGKTPPCVESIIKNKISKVVVGTLDPNPLISGKGIKRLKESGIEVTVGVLEEECKKLNEVFIKYIVYKKPFVVLKTAMSLDGKIATSKGESKWISSEESRKNAHLLRNSLSAIMVGVNTVIKDNSRLTCRIPNGRNPIRIILDSKLRVPIDSKVVTDKESETIVCTTEKCSEKKFIELEKLGVKVLKVKEKDNRIDMKNLMETIGELKIDSILLEGGGEVNFSALESGIVDKVQIYIAPNIIGGRDSKTPVEGIGIDKLKDSFNVTNLSTKFIKNDLFIEGYLRI